MNDFCLSLNAIKANYRLEQFEEIASTNIYAIELAKSSDNDKVWIVTNRQTRGKGRLGREWQSLSGNLATSLLLQTELAPQKCALLGFIAGVALVGAIKSFNSQLNVQLKWPNDVMLDGQKLAGILLETQNSINAKQAIIIGFGVNVAKAPKDLPYKAISLNEAGVNIVASDLFERLTDYWHQLFTLSDSGKNLAEILNSWKDCAFGLGKQISITNHNKIIHGIFEDIDATGRLVIRNASNEKQYITAGDVHFGAASSFRG